MIFSGGGGGELEGEPTGGTCAVPGLRITAAPTPRKSAIAGTAARRAITQSPPVPLSLADTAFSSPFWTGLTRPSPEIQDSPSDINPVPGPTFAVSCGISTAVDDVLQRKSPRADTARVISEIRYARSGDVSIA
jgi:hypothetical protein